VRVEAEGAERMSLIGLFLRAALLERSDAIEHARLHGDLAVTVAGMSATLSFAPEAVTVREGVVGRPRAHIKGSMESFLAMGRGKVVSPVLRREVRISGNPLAALPLALLFRRTRGGT
jgi:hypothetical protein